MSFIEITVMGKTGFVAVESIVAVLSNVNTKPGSVLYMEEPVGAVEVDESAEEVYELIYEATPSGEDDDEHGLCCSRKCRRALDRKNAKPAKAAERDA